MFGKVACWKDNWGLNIGVKLKPTERYISETAHVLYSRAEGYDGSSKSQVFFGGFTE